MRSQAPPLLPVFRSRHQGRLLAALLLHPEREAVASELARELNIPLTTITTEAGRLSEAGILTTRQVGRRTTYSANPQGRLVAPLTQLVAATFGPVEYIASEFSSLSAEAVVIFGSWARRWLGDPGPRPHDVDVLILGADLSRSDAYSAAERVEEATGFPVNPVLRPVAAWVDPSDQLVVQIRTEPHVVALGSVPEDGI